MKIPTKSRDLLDFAREQVAICAYSQEERAQQYAIYQNYYDYGTRDGDTRSLYNRTQVHIDRLCSYLYSLGEVRYSITYDATEEEPWLARAVAAAKYLSREYHRSDADSLFAQGVKLSAIKCCAILKHNYFENDHMIVPELIHPEFFGVGREDLDSLDRQQVMLHGPQYLSREEILRSCYDNPDRKQLETDLDKLMASPKPDDKRNHWLHQVIIGGIKPVQPQGAQTPSPSGGRATVFASGSALMEPRIKERLLRLDELWVMNDDLEDFTTLKLVEGEFLVEGKYKHRNLMGVKGCHPFSRICSLPVPGYFFGASEVQRVVEIQDMLTERLGDIRRLLKLQVKPPKAFIGFSGMTQQKLRAAMSPGGYIQEQSPGAKIEDLIPKIPQEAFQEVQEFERIFDEIGGFKPIMQGQAESGVRANVHAQTLLRTASPKLRERALHIERDAEESASITMRILQEKNARVFVSSEKERFLLKQLPDDYHCEVDSHSSSPAFSEDARDLAFGLAARGAVGPEELIRLTHPPMEDYLLAAAKKRQQAQAEFVKEHPEVLQHPGRTGRK